MVDIGKKYFGYSGMIIHRESRDKQYLADVPNRRCPDITKARKELGYSPAIDINEGLLRAMYWYSENHKCKEES
jgi:nucleoside-diphosphate-sugar epimerase